MKFATLIVFLFLCLPVAFLVAVVDSEPIVKTVSPPSSLDAKRARTLLKRLHLYLDPAFKSAGGRRQLWAKETELNSFLSAAVHGLPYLQSNAEVAPDAVRLSLSVELPKVLLGGWLNLAMSVPPSTEGLRLSSLNVSGFRLPSSLSQMLFAKALNLILGRKLGDDILNKIERVSIQKKTVVLDISLPTEIRGMLMARAKERLSQLARLGNPEDVRVYYRALDQMAGKRRLDPRGSFIAYLQFVFELARQRSELGDAVKENRSAILALAIYCGHWRIENLIGEVLTEDLKLRKAVCDQVTLGGRSDLRRHFIVSAALEIAGKSEVAFAVGELKELLDSNWRGSGFSFVDLAADRAGIRFAAKALNGRHHAMAVQTMLSRNADEEEIFPDISDLPEGLSDTNFQQLYGDVKNPAYREVVEEIDRRLDVLPVYARY